MPFVKKTLGRSPILFRAHARGGTSYVTGAGLNVTGKNFQVPGASTLPLGSKQSEALASGIPPLSQTFQPGGASAIGQNNQPASLGGGGQLPAKAAPGSIQAAGLKGAAGNAFSLPGGSGGGGVIPHTNPLIPIPDGAWSDSDGAWGDSDGMWTDSN